VGAFPAPWSEWNGRYRGDVRDAWAGQDYGVARLLPRLLGSADLYDHSARMPTASINFATSHDGFTLPSSASLARPRVLKKRAAHSHLSSRIGFVLDWSWWKW
jgi:glycogen operon protein